MDRLDSELRAMTWGTSSLNRGGKALATVRQAVAAYGVFVDTQFASDRSEGGSSQLGPPRILSQSPLRAVGILCCYSWDLRGLKSRSTSPVCNIARSWRNPRLQEARSPQGTGA